VNAVGININIDVACPLSICLQLLVTVLASIKVLANFVHVQKVQLGKTVVIVDVLAPLLLVAGCEVVPALRTRQVIDGPQLRVLLRFIVIQFSVRAIVTSICVTIKMLEEHLLAHKLTVASQALEGSMRQMAELVRLQLPDGALGVGHGHPLVALQAQVVMVIDLTEVKSLAAVKVVLLHDVFAPEGMRVKVLITLGAEVRDEVQVHGIVVRDAVLQRVETSGSGW